MRISNRGKLRRSAQPAPTPDPPLVEFHDVSLTRARTPVLDHLDLIVRPGEHVALVGLSAAATTALTHLLTGQATPTHGHLLLHTGTRLLTPEPTLAQAVCGHSAPAPDDPHLAHALTHTDLTPDHLHTPLHALPAHLTPRIHHAQDLYAQSTNSRLLLRVDPATQHAAPSPTPHTGLLTLTRQPAHARKADRILLLYKGRVAETGDHHQLLVRGGAYARMYALTGTHRHTSDALR